MRDLKESYSIKTKSLKMWGFGAGINSKAMQSNGFERSLII